MRPIHISVVLLFLALVLLVLILMKNRTANIQKVWEFALNGDRLARIYMLVIVSAFVLAVVEFIII